MKKLIALIVLCGAGFVSLADTGPFLEAGLGYTGTPMGGSGVSLDNKDYAGWNADAGFLMWGLGAEVGYTRYGNIAATGEGQETAVGIDATHIAARIQKGLGPLSFIVKLGYAYLQQDAFSNDNFQSASEGKGSLYYAVGAAFSLTDMWSVQLVYEGINPSNTLPDMSMTSLGLGYHF